MLDLAQVRTLLLAERSRDVAVIAEAVDRIGDERGSEPARYRNGVPRCRLAHLFDRKPELTIVIGMPAWRSALDRLECHRKKTATHWRAPRAIHD